MKARKEVVVSMHHFRFGFRLILKRIENADEYEFNEIVRMLIHRHSRKYPESELSIITLDKFDHEARIQQIDYIASLLRKYTYERMV